jgi:hypothetical protein
MLYFPGRVYIASDSKIASLNGQINETGCKVHVTKNYVWASSGLLLETNGTFNIEQFVPNAMRDGLDFYQSASILETQLKLAVPRLVEDVRATGEDINKAQIGIALINRRAVGQVSEIFVANSVLQRRDCPGRECSDMGVFLFGEHRGVDSALNANREIWKDFGIVPALNYLIRQQESLTPQYVNGPVAIIEVTPQNAKWIQKGKCDK